MSMLSFGLACFGFIRQSFLGESYQDFLALTVKISASFGQFFREINFMRILFLCLGSHVCLERANFLLSYNHVKEVSLCSDSSFISCNLICSTTLTQYVVYWKTQPLFYENLLLIMHRFSIFKYIVNAISRVKICLILSFQNGKFKVLVFRYLEFLLYSGFQKIRIFYQCINFPILPQC